MNKGQKVLAAMLAVAVVVLAMVAFAPRPPTPKVVSGEVTGTNEIHKLFRFYDDGTVDVTVYFGVECPQLTICGPVVVLP